MDGFELEELEVVYFNFVGVRIGVRVLLDRWGVCLYFFMLRGGYK